MNDITEFNMYDKESDMMSRRDFWTDMGSRGMKFFGNVQQAVRAVRHVVGVITGTKVATFGWTDPGSVNMGGEKHLIYRANIKRLRVPQILLLTSSIYISTTSLYFIRGAHF